MSKLICQVYRSSKKADMYLYVDKKEQLARVPEALLKLFGTPQEAMVLLITPEKQLAKLSGDELIKQIEENGYYLQMPPLEDSEMKDIAVKNSKLAR